MTEDSRIEFRIRKDRFEGLKGGIVNLTERVWEVDGTSTVETVSPVPNSSDDANPDLLFRTYTVSDQNGHYVLTTSEGDESVIGPNIGSYGRWKGYLSEVDLIN